LAAALLGAAIGSGSVLLAFRNKGLRETHVLPSLFVVVFLAILGACALKPSVNLAVATSAALLIALAVGGTADWFIFLARKYPATPHLFPAVFMTMFLLVLGVGGCDALTSPARFGSTARSRLRMGTSPGDRLVRDPQLLKRECDIIRSTNILNRVIEGLDLNKEWGARYNLGNPLTTPETIEYLKRCLHVRPIPGTNLIEICAQSEYASPTSRIRPLKNYF